ncbi:MAG: rhodanese-like domain-containing protein [Gammaproteobacteria bacterium]|nr:rhodanese-like domain-containing protein [Gammaproteobacteria bacterium]MBQ0841103.1 rhodanese-like domain-containing protein [Gammaproteobacteria bacterium]
MDFFVFISEHWLLVSGLLVLIYVFAFSEQKKAGKQLSVHELTRLLNDDAAILIDLRDSKEYATGCITGAINIPLAKLDGRISELEKHRTKKIVLVDKIGQQSAAAGRKLRLAGYDAQRLRGGMGEWLHQSLPVVNP